LHIAIPRQVYKRNKNEAMFRRRRVHLKGEETKRERGLTLGAVMSPTMYKIR